MECAELILTSSVDRLIQYCTNTKDFMVPSMWGSVSRIYMLIAIPSHPLPLLVLASVPLSHIPPIAEAGLILLAQLPGRQTRGSLRTSTVKRMLHNHVEHTTSISSAFQGFFRFSSIPKFFRPIDCLPRSLLHQRQRILITTNISNLAETIWFERSTETQKLIQPCCLYITW